MDLIKEAKKILSIPSITTESNKEIVDYLSELVKPLDVSVRLQSGENYGKPQYNLILHKGPLEGKSLLFNTHVDTVSAGDYSLWNKTGGNPFRATVVEDKIYGLGAADVKLDILCKLKALEKYKDIPFKHPFYLIGTFGEESGLVGVNEFIKKESIKPTYAVVGEASNLNIVYAHKGIMIFDIVIKDTQMTALTKEASLYRLDLFGKAAHSSTPDLGENAILKGFDFLKKNENDLKVVAFEGGELVNIVPGRAHLVFEASQKLLPSDPRAQLAIETGTNTGSLFSQESSRALVALESVFKQCSQRLKKDPMSEFNPPTNLINVGTVHTKEDSITFQISIRTLPSLDTNEFKLFIVSEINQKMATFPSLNVDVKLIREGSSMMTETDSLLIREARHTLRAMGLQDVVVTKAGSTEASVYRKAGAEVIVWGPGVAIGNIHKPNEFNYLSHLTHAVTFYEKMIDKFCVKGVK